jgi:archaellum component FlaG (FlaF/FlaG flagellin family)
MVISILADASNWAPVFMTWLGVVVAAIAAGIAWRQFIHSKQQAEASAKNADRAQKAWERIAGGVERRVALSKPGNQGCCVGSVDGVGGFVCLYLYTFRNTGNVPITIDNHSIDVEALKDGQPIPASIRKLELRGAGTPRGYCVECLTLAQGESGEANIKTSIPAEKGHTYQVTVHIKTDPPLDEGQWVFKCSPYTVPGGD